ncbi:MAG: chemotaxis protein CheB [Pseudomonadota bacterium]|nr:chemotaxis protein CheB [Pseudomonadota bacterium]
MIKKTESARYSEDEKEIIFSYAERLTGSCQRGRYRKEILLNNVEKRMHARGLTNLSHYLKFATTDAEEKKYLLSALTIHTTAWFREPSHYSKIEKLVIENMSEFEERPLTMMCAACSTGEEVYSFGLVFESIRASFPKFNYKIVGFDIDPISVEKGQKAVYPAEDILKSISEKFTKFLLVGSGKTEGRFTLDKEIRSRCEFTAFSLKDEWPSTDLFDIVTCRNALIYFEPNVMATIVNNLTKLMKPNGLFVVGTSDFIDAPKNKLHDLGKSIYVFEGEAPLSKFANGPKILVVDDSSTIRSMLTKLLIKSGFRVDAVESAAEASEFLRKNNVNLITLDLHMPGMDGQTWLSQQRASGLKTPVVIISGANPTEAKSVLHALGSGAQDYFEKEKLMEAPKTIVQSLFAIIESYDKRKNRKVNIEASKDESVALKLTKKPPRRRPDLILLGASTGGTEALKIILDKMPINSPPIIVVQHISSGFAKAFHEKLASSSGLVMAEAAPGVQLKPGHLYMAHGDYHIELTKKYDELFVKNSYLAPINGIRPSIDHLFRSAAVTDSHLMAGILTGMGRDGAQGLLEIKKKGGITLAQDEDSCVVFGMPKVAIGINAASIVANLVEIRAEIKAAIAGE